MSDICTDNRFEVIERYKQKLIEATNIEQSPKEMEVLDTLLFRFWQMGWLERKEDEVNATANRNIDEDHTGIEKALESIAIDMHKQTRLMQELIMTLEKMRKGQK